MHSSQRVPSISTFVRPEINIYITGKSGLSHDMELVVQRWPNYWFHCVTLFLVHIVIQIYNSMS